MAVQVITVLLFLSIVVPFGVYFLGQRGERRFRHALLLNVVTFFGVLLFATVFMFSQPLYANPVTESGDAGMAFLAAALVTGLATVGTGIATGQAASAALGAISENEKLMGKALIFVALAEGIAIYGLLISFTILGRV